MRLSDGRCQPPRRLACSATASAAFAAVRDVIGVILAPLRQERGRGEVRSRPCAASTPRAPTAAMRSWMQPFPSHHCAERDGYVPERRVAPLDDATGLRRRPPPISREALDDDVDGCTGLEEQHEVVPETCWKWWAAATGAGTSRCGSLTRSRSGILSTCRRPSCRTSTMTVLSRSVWRTSRR